MSVMAILGVISAVAPIIGATVWLIRLEGRVNMNKQGAVDLKELISIQLSNIDKRLDRIERSLNGKLKEA